MSHAQHQLCTAIRLIVISCSCYVAVVHYKNIVIVSKMCYQSSLNKWQCILLPLRNFVHLLHCFYWLWGLLGDIERHDFIPSFVNISELIRKLKWVDTRTYKCIHIRHGSFFCGEVALRDDELIDKRNRGKNWLHVECQNVLGQYLAPVCSCVFMNLFRLSFISVFSSLTSYYQHCKLITFLVMATSLTLSWPKCLEIPPQCLYVSVPTLSTHVCVLIVISVGMINCTIL